MEDTDYTSQYLFHDIHDGTPQTRVRVAARSRQSIDTITRKRSCLSLYYPPIAALLLLDKLHIIRYTKQRQHETQRDTSSHRTWEHAHVTPRILTLPPSLPNLFNLRDTFAFAERDLVVFCGVVTRGME
jgi:hypothetical protein